MLQLQAMHTADELEYLVWYAWLLYNELHSLHLIKILNLIINATIFENIKILLFIPSFPEWNFLHHSHT